MTAPDRYLLHLTTILHGWDDSVQHLGVSGKTVEEFFDEIAADRVRIGKTDWQGRKLTALLWNQPSLKPPSLAALSDHLAERWHAYKADSAVNFSQTDAVGTIGLQTIPIGQDNTETETESFLESTQERQPSALSATTGSTTVRRDWFDSLTDWVAAIVSLWK